MNRRIDSLETKRTFILNDTRLDFDDTEHWKTGDSIGPCETFDSSRKRNIFIRSFSFICATVLSHVTCTPSLKRSSVELRTFCDLVASWPMISDKLYLSNSSTFEI